MPDLPPSAKLNMEKCKAAETKMENLFNDGNSKLAAYKDEKNNLVAIENDYHKAGMGNILEKTENAQKTITNYLQGLKEQNAFLKQQIEFSPNNMMTNGIGATFGTLAAGEIVNHYCQWENGFLQGDWTTCWFIFATFALIVGVSFALVFHPDKK